MADRYPYNPQEQQHDDQYNPHPAAQRVGKILGAVTVGGTLVVLSGLTMVATVIGLTVIMPLLVIFSPVLIPAAITVFLIALGFASSCGLGVAALSVVAWLYRYMTGKHPVEARELDEADMSLAGKARDFKEGVGHRMDQTQSGRVGE